MKLEHFKLDTRPLYISDARFKPCVVFFILRFRAISELNDKIILKTVVLILF